MIGKYPPIEGGVCMQNYWAAHGLARRGHDVHVVTNSKEVGALHRMHMRPEDWRRCEADYNPGSVTVHWTETLNPSQFYIPTANPFATKLATIVAGIHATSPLDIILSYYLEPYGIAGHLAGEMTGVPNVVRMAGSDAGRLWHHPQLEAVYDHVLRRAERVITGSVVASRAIARGIEAGRIVSLHGYPAPPELFVDDGPSLDIAGLCAEIACDPNPEVRDLVWGGFKAERPYFGVCGKLGEEKGSYPLLGALRRLRDAGLDIGLVAVAHGQEPVIEAEFRSRAQDLELFDSILQLPFVPHWRVAEFLRGCLAVCCLEQDFPIVFHTPTIALETLLSGTCLVASTELIRKLPQHYKLPVGYGCVAVEDVQNVDLLTRTLQAIATDPEPARAVGTRGRRYAHEMVRNSRYTEILEQILESAAARRPIVAPDHRSAATSEAKGSFSLASNVASSLRESLPMLSHSDGELDIAFARAVKAAVQAASEKDPALKRLLPALAIELDIAIAEHEIDLWLAEEKPAALRLQIARWGLADGMLPDLIPICEATIRVLHFDYDVARYRGIETMAEVPDHPVPGSSHLVVIRRAKSQTEILQLDAQGAHILELSDGTRTAAQVADQLATGSDRSTNARTFGWIEQLFAYGILSLRDSTSGNVRQGEAAHGTA